MDNDDVKWRQCGTAVFTWCGIVVVVVVLSITLKLKTVIKIPFPRAITFCRSSFVHHTYVRRQGIWSFMNS